MGAKEKLNAWVIRGVICIAAITGLFFESWLVFVATAAVLIACSAHSGELRPSTPKPRRH